VEAALACREACHAGVEPKGTLANSSCGLALSHAVSIPVRFRNRGSQPVSVISGIEPAGNYQCKTGSERPLRIAAITTRGQQTPYLFGGSLAGTTLTVRISACTPTT